MATSLRESKSVSSKGGCKNKNNVEGLGTLVLPRIVKKKKKGIEAVQWYEREIVCVCKRKSAVQRKEEG